MKIFFPEPRSGPLLTKLRGAPRIISFIIICLFAGLVGSYLLDNHFGVLAIMVLGIVGILLGAPAYALLYWSKIGQARCAPGAPLKRNLPRIKSVWDYRPKQAIRRYAAVHSAKTETSDVLSPAPFAIDNHVWLPEDSYINAEIHSSLQSAHLHSSKI
jgi:uncharacterized membrane protein YeaQ/YmgE (transglycosylase-associated protein family)